ncbi:MAG: GIY-YIG nuclease family protein, partial [Paludibacteraceae bacterium]|nr:GIY-YIG nuclease family protein [Paludibacteraceae bacterium]
MSIQSFSPDVQAKIGYYVYRLIDPRDYSTFYVGKGKGNRVFEHAKAAIKFSKNSDEDEASAKI